MKRMLITLLVIIASIECLEAQIFKQKRAYQYKTLITLNANFQPIEEMTIDGVIVFTDADDKEFISITIGEEVVYNGLIKQQKVTTQNQEKTKVYLFVTEFQGVKIPLQLFEIYDQTVSDVIPSKFILFIYNATTDECVQGQHFDDIVQIR